MPFATVSDGTRLYYEVSGQGEPLLLISGQGLDHRLWDSVRDDFADRYQVIVYDHRGTGQSDKPTSPYSTRLFAQDAVSILDHLCIERAHAYGISMGGRICQWLGIEHSERLGGLILCATSPGDAHGVCMSTSVNILFAQPVTDERTYRDAFLALFYSPAWIKANPKLADESIFQTPPLPGYVRRLHYLASHEHNSWDLLPTLNVPTLVVHGDDDHVNPTANAFLLAERIPGAELALIAGGRHGYILEMRVEASVPVKEFLARHPLSKR